MSDLPPFTLVYESPVESIAGAGSDDSREGATGGHRGFAFHEMRDLAGDTNVSVTRTTAEVQALPQLEAMKRAAPELAKSLKSLELNPNLQRTLLSTSFLQTAVGADDEHAVQALRPVVEDLKRHEDVATVALWDLDARAGQLPKVIKLLNEAQPVITFFELQGAPLPTTLIAHQQRVTEWVRERLHKQHRRLTKKIRQEIKNCLIANDFYGGARVIYERIGVKYLIGITQYMIAGDDPSDLFWDYFSASEDKILLVSTYGLRGYARRAGRPFEVALAMLFIAQLLVEVSSNLFFHEDTGCIFDFNYDRATIVQGIRELKIDEGCLKKINKKYREAALEMLDALRSYTEAEAAEEAEEVDYDYWLNKLDKLGEEKEASPEAEPQSINYFPLPVEDAAS